MEKAIRHSISELANELKVFNQNDVLVNLKDAENVNFSMSSLPFCLPNSLELQRIFKKSKQIFKESGANVFCVSEGILHWEWKGKPCKSPILLCPAQISFDKIKQEFRIDFSAEDAFLNPFLEISFRAQFDFEWQNLDFLDANWNKVESDMRAKGFSLAIEPDLHVGNFHHHRFNVLRDVESLENENELSNPLLEILHHKNTDKQDIKNLSKHLLFPADNDQLAVFEKMEKSNLVVQGPPGTGKSQVLANVISKLLFQGHKTLVVSEKRVALEVLEKKMVEFGLDKFIFIPGKEQVVGSFLSQIKKTWLFLESYEKKKPFQLHLSKQKLDNFQFKLNVLSQPNIVGGLSFSEFQKRTQNIDAKEASFSSQTATIAEWDAQKEFLATIYQQKLQTLLAVLPKNRVADEDFLSLQEKFQTIEKKYLTLQNSVVFDTKDELLECMKNATIAQLLVNEKDKDYYKTLKPNSAEQKKFKKQSKLYFALQKELEIRSEEKKNWKTTPTLVEAVELLKITKDGSFLQKLKASKRLKMLLKSKFIPAQKALENWIEFLEKEHDFQKIQFHLQELGVADETEMNWVKNLAPKLVPEDFQIWEKNKLEANRKLADSNDEISAFYQLIRTYLQIDENQSISAVISLLTDRFSDVIVHREALLKLSDELYKQVGKHDTLESLEKEILKSSWLQFMSQFPMFENFSADQINDDLDEMIRLQKEEASDFSEEIIHRIKAQFDALFTFVNASSRKLSEEEKIRKARLKKGRSILVKEFSKTRNHPSLRELLQSEASDWIEVLIPIWMASPAQVADFFPLTKNTFDFALFDEATQIPLVNSLGALQRSKRTLVVGDEQQMTPSNFFKTGDSEPLDLLHQARFTWEKIMLKHHYRSEHPELISFSNRHFYNNELIAYPSAQRIDNVIENHFVPTGQWLERENAEEAKAMAKYLETLLTSKESLGIVAFNETQLACIFQQLSAKAKILLEERIEENTCFFRALENIQGDECDHLVISLGYAPNAEGKLLLNFGPLNRKSGRRRLNVLFTRAKKKIDFFTSIRAQDLNLSENDSINLLRLFLLQVENSREESQVLFPYNLNGIVSKTGGKVLFENSFKQIDNANEFLTLHRVLCERGWNPKYT